MKGLRSLTEVGGSLEFIRIRMATILTSNKWKGNEAKRS